MTSLINKQNFKCMRVYDIGIEHRDSSGQLTLPHINYCRYCYSVIPGLYQILFTWCESFGIEFITGSTRHNDSTIVYYLFHSRPIESELLEASSSSPYSEFEKLKTNSATHFGEIGIEKNGWSRFTFSWIAERRSGRDESLLFVSNI